MKIVPLTKDRYQEWDEFCLRSNDAWFWHTSKWLEFTLNYRPDLKSTSLSFEVTEGCKILAICPVLLETIKFENGVVLEFSFGASSTWAPAFANDLSDRKRERVINTTFDHVDRLARENGVVRASFKLCPLAPRFLNSNVPQNNYFMKRGYMDVSVNTQIIYLAQDLKAIRNGVRKGHHYDINRGFKQLEVVTLDKSNILRDDYEKYCELHHKAAGRITRPIITFEMMYDWILGGDAMLFGAKLGEKNVGFSYVFTYKKRAYYGSACNDPEYPQMPIGHVLHWRAIEWLKEHDFEYYEIGYQQYGCLPHDFPSQDEINISYFKRGFGGFTAPYFHGEKYYSKDYYVKVNLERLNKYASYVSNASLGEQSDEQEALADLRAD